MATSNLLPAVNDLICDNILRKFEGNISIPLAATREPHFYNNIDPDVNVVDDHIRFLIRDRTLKESEALLSLTTKGWFILTNTDKVGYVARRIESAQWEKGERDNRNLVRGFGAITIVGLAAWLVFRLLTVQH